MINCLSYNLSGTFGKMKWLKQRDIIDESIDWAGALVFQALHDMDFKFRFGERRLEKIGDDIDGVQNEDSGFLMRWKNKIEKNGYNHLLVCKLAETLEKKLTHNTQNMELKRNAQDMIIGSIIVIIYKAAFRYDFEKCDILKIMEKLKLYEYLIRKNELTIYDFMKCLQRECNVQFPVLDEYETKHGKVDIGPRHAIYIKERNK